MEKLQIRQGKTEDLDSIAALEKRCFAVPWSREALLSDLTENERSFYLTADLEGEIAGYIGVWMILDECQINNVAVSPDCRRKQIGSRLMQALFETMQARKIAHLTLEVRVGNEAAIGLYEKFGFQRAGIRKEYYQDNKEDALIMWRSL